MEATRHKRRSRCSGQVRPRLELFIFAKHYRISHCKKRLIPETPIKISWWKNIKTYLKTSGFKPSWICLFDQRTQTHTGQETERALKRQQVHTHTCPAKGFFMLCSGNITDCAGHTVCVGAQSNDEVWQSEHVGHKRLPEGGTPARI